LDISVEVLVIYLIASYCNKKKDAPKGALILKEEID